MSAATEDAYWNAFYAGRRPDIESPSSFAQHVLSQVNPGATLFELGCGNGRDALFFASRGLRVVACDRSQVAIATLNERDDLAAFAHRPQFLAADFAALASAYRGGPPDAVYSRFTLHAVPPDVQHAALGWARQALRPGGKLFIEVRSVLGSLYGKGEPAGDRDAYIHDGHYRRFLRNEELQAQLTGAGFTIAQASESAGVAVYRDDDPVVIRITAVAP